jgi:hypothetical protein
MLDIILVVPCVFLIERFGIRKIVCVALLVEFVFTLIAFFVARDNKG